MKSSVDNDRQFELDALGCSKPVETDDSICNMLRATESGDRPLSAVMSYIVMYMCSGRIQAIHVHAQHRVG